MNPWKPDDINYGGLKLEDEVLKSCPTCRYTAGKAASRQREPVRPLRAVTVADVHILAQNMLNAVREKGSQKPDSIFRQPTGCRFQGEGWEKGIPLAR